MSEFWQFIQSRAPELGDKFLEHLLLTGTATLIAIAIGLAAGILLTRNERLKGPVMGLVNALQTVPSLAMLAFLLPLFGIGIVPALIALTLYALLPIMRNTLTGIEELPAEILEACAALGFTGRQRLWQVELPLALPTIMAGIRTAAVISVGVATLAAFIGAGGLGDFIIRGLAVNNVRLVLLGAVPAAVLALGLDRLLQWLERRLRQRRKPVAGSGSGGRLLAGGLGLAGLLLIATVTWWRAPGGDIIRVASKNFTEQFILAELMAQMIEAHSDLRVERKLNLGSVTIVHNALLNGAVDLYPEYTGTAWRAILNRDRTLAPGETWREVRESYLAKYDLVWLKPFGFDNTFAVFVTEQLAAQHGLRTISELAPLAPRLTMGFGAEFHERPDGYRGLVAAYGLSFADTAEMEMGLLYRAVREGKIDVAAGNSTDGRIPAFNLRVLADDRGYFPPYEAAPVVRAAVLERHPELETILNRLGGAIDLAAMQAMNRAVDQHKRLVEEVARAFLVERRLLPGRDQ